ncbi:MAG: hypothetical protein MJK12_02530 [Colwellia sp.]|nr:hypothetical protein [Colwellia sp.]
MKRLSILLFTLLIISGCSSSGNGQQSSDTRKCVIASKEPQNNSDKSGDDLFNECLDKKYQKRNQGNGFWENTLEGIVFFVLDVVAS